MKDERFFAKYQYQYFDKKTKKLLKSGYIERIFKNKLTAERFLKKTASDIKKGTSKCYSKNIKSTLRKVI